MSPIPITKAVPQINVENINPTHFASGEATAVSVAPTIQSRQHIEISRCGIHTAFGERLFRANWKDSEALGRQSSGDDVGVKVGGGSEVEHQLKPPVGFPRIEQSRLLAVPSHVSGDVLDAWVVWTLKTFHL
jgi:hypothetical protein